MNYEPRQPSSDTATGAPQRFPPAFLLSLAINALFLLGAASMLREHTEPLPSGETGYVILALSEREKTVSATQQELPQPEPPVKVVPTDLTTREKVAVAVVKRVRESEVRAHQTRQETQTEKISAEPTPAVAKKLAEVVDKKDVPAPTVAQDDAGAGVAASSSRPGAPASPTGEVGMEETGTAPVASPTPVASASPAAASATAPAGITKEAELAYQELPRLPDSLRDSGYRSFVRVAVTVAEGGDFTVTIRDSSGNKDIDGRVLDALKRWKWKPALRNGTPETSTQIIRFDFGVN